MIHASRSLLLVFTAVAAPPVAQEELAISVNVDLVVLNATVRDRTGAPAPNLREKNFKVFEDGVLQTIRLFRHEDLAVTAGLIVDHSGSMRVKLATAVAAARSFVRRSSPEDEMFVVNFNEIVSLGLPPDSPFSNSQDELANAISIAAADGRTALYDGVAAGLRHLQTGRREKKVLVVISDGADNASTTKLPDLLRTAILTNTAIYTIGIFDEADPDRNPGVLRRMARETGGESFIPSYERNLNAICEQIAADIRRQYTIGYFSSSPSPSAAFRRIRLKAEAPGMRALTVSTRSGYYPGGGK